MTNKPLLSNGNPNESDGSSTDSKNRDNREAWSNNWQFIFSALAYCVGLGNIWRFPYLCAQSGAGAFLIPYFLITAIMGTSLLYTEIALGQMTQKGVVGAFSFLKKQLPGVGHASMMIIFLLSSYYVAVVAWGLKYLTISLIYLGRELPWQNGTTEREYWENNILQKTSGIEESGGIIFSNLIFLVLIWIGIFLTIIKGKRIMAKVAETCVTIPYFILLLLLVITMSTNGSELGISYFITPRWDQLKSVTVWQNAAVQVFNSIGIACGSMVVYGSFVPEKNTDLLKNTFIIVGLNCFTSILAGFVIFAAIGNISYAGRKISKIIFYSWFLFLRTCVFATGKDVTEIAAEGVDLLFVVYPKVFTLFGHWGSLLSCISGLATVEEIRFGI